MKLKLSNEQQKIIMHASGALFVHRRPGSGTGTALVERARRLITTQNGNFGILVLTFVRTTRDKYSQRFDEIPGSKNRVYAKTFDDFCVDVIKKYGRTVGFDDMPNILSEYERTNVLREVVADALPATGFDEGPDFREIYYYSDEIEQAKEWLKTPELVAHPSIRQVYENYEARLRSMRVIDQQDLALLTYRILRERPSVAVFYRKQYRHIWLDGAEMLTEAQYHVLLALCYESQQHIILIKDIRQRSYRHSRNHDILRRFLLDFDVEETVMKDVFTSSKGIVNAMRNIKSDVYNGIQFPILGEVKLFVADDEEHEVQLVLKQIENLQENGHPDLENGFNFERCAVVGRNRYVMASLEKKLRSRSWQYEFPRMIRRESDLLEQFRLCLQIIHNPEDRMAWQYLRHHWGLLPNREPFKGLSGLVQIQDALNHSLNPAEPNPHIPAVLDALHFLFHGQIDRFDFANALDLLHVYAQNLQGIERNLTLWEINDWQKQWFQFMRQDYKEELGPFLQYMATSSKRRTEGKADTLSLHTVHTLNGNSQPYDVVFLMGMTEGVFPDSSNKSSNFDDERMLLLQAMSKARRLLYFSYPKSRIEVYGEGKVWNQKASVFLEKIGF